MKALAVDLGGTHAQCAVVEDNKILAAKHLDLDSAQGLSTVLPRLAETFRELLAVTHLTEKDCAGLSFGSCGIVDSSTSRFLSMNQKWSDAPQLDLVGWSRRELFLPVRLENDARMALLGEWYAGAGRGVQNLVMITLGTGIGGAALIEGKLLRGKHYQAGNLGGHQPVLFNGRKCTCGSIGCAEAEAAGWSLPLVAGDWPGFEKSLLAKEPQVNFEALFRLAEARDTVSLAVRDRCLHVWAAAAVGLVHAFDPEVVIFGGGVMRSAATILPFIQDYVAKHAWTPWGKVQVRAAELGNDAGLFGAVPLLSEKN
ncbi:MAG: ROK family protein [Acidipila sp.]|nr:ROK family protein [Acidipila sp.]